MAMAKFFRVELLLLVAVFAIGCGGSDEFNRNMVSVSGKITVKGEPVKADKNLFVIFEKAGERPESIAVNSDGTYSGKAPAGENRVGLQVYGPLEALGPIKKEYTEGSPLSAQVESGKEINFEVGE